MLTSYRTTLFLATLLSTFPSLMLACPVSASNSNGNITASYTPSLSILAPVPTSTVVRYPSNSNKTAPATATTATFLSSPTGVSNGTIGSNSTTPSNTGRPLSPSATPVSTSAGALSREFGLGSLGLAAVIALAVATL